TSPSICSAAAGCRACRNCGNRSSSCTVAANPDRAPGIIPTGLVPVERRLLHKRGGPHLSAPTRLAPVGRRLLPQLGRSPLLWCNKPSLHRGKPGGGDVPPRFPLCRSLRSTGA